MSASNEWPVDSTKTKLEWLEKPITSDEVSQSPPVPQPSDAQTAVEADFAARTEKIRRPGPGR
jgi:hypothetical protein